MMTQYLSIILLLATRQHKTIYYLEFPDETYLAVTRQRILKARGTIDEKHWTQLVSLLEPHGKAGRRPPLFDEAKVRFRIDIAPKKSIYVDQHGVATDTSNRVWALPSRNFKLIEAILEKHFKAHYIE